MVSNNANEGHLKANIKRIRGEGARNEEGVLTDVGKT